jgi:DNA-binding Lrp family transcriptional regulator
MRKLLVIGCMASGLLALGAGSIKAMAETARAYLLIEAAQIDTVRQGLDGMANCKALDAPLWPGELVVHVECNDLASLNAVIADHIAKIEGVARTTVWLVAPSR